MCLVWFQVSLFINVSSLILSYFLFITVSSLIPSYFMFINVSSLIPSYFLFITVSSFIPSYFLFINVSSLIPSYFLFINVSSLISICWRLRESISLRAKSWFPPIYLNPLQIITKSNYNGRNHCPWSNYLIFVRQSVTLIWTLFLYLLGGSSSWSLKNDKL